MRSLAIVIVLIATCVGPSPAPAVDVQPDDYQRILIDEAMRCGATRNPDPFLLWRILELEVLAGLPKDLEGLTLAAACTESGFNHLAIGDCLKGGRCRARGILQLWPWWTRYYGVDRWNPEHSAEAWIAHLVRQVPKTRRACPRLRGLKIWRAAQVRSVRAPGPKRCRQRSYHWKRWKRWIAKVGRR